MIAPIARIILRYLAAVLVTAGYLTADAGADLAADPDLLLVFGAVLGAATEGLYALAKRFGWAT